MPNNTKKEECKHLNIESNMCPETCKDCGVIIDKNKEECKNKDKGCNHGRAENSEYCLSCQIRSENKEEECHCQRTDRLHRVDSNFKNHTFERCWKDSPSPQSPLSEEKCICGRKKHEWTCKPYVDSVVSPSSNEDWDKSKEWYEIRLEAQRELAEAVINYMEDGLDKPTDWYVSVKNFLSSRGLLPKITE